MPLSTDEPSVIFGIGEGWLREFRAIAVYPDGRRLEVDGLGPSLAGAGLYRAIWGRHIWIMNIQISAPEAFQAVAVQRGYASAQSYFDSDPLQALADLSEAIAEQENIDLMATLSTKVTGIDNLLIYTPLPGGQHGPRIKVAIDPPHRATGKQASVPFDPGKLAEGPIDRGLELRVREFIGMNRPALEEYWHRFDEVSTDEFIAKLRPITR